MAMGIAYDRSRATTDEETMALNALSGKLSYYPPMSMGDIPGGTQED